MCPWHLRVQIAPGLSTKDFHEADPEPSDHGFYDPAPRVKGLLSSIYPGGLDGKTVLDCVCNNGAFLFAAREVGAGPCFGVDVREHWIKQAHFLARHRGESNEDIEFRTLDLYELPKLDLELFDITFFSGVFYHLPDPILGVKIAADLTREVLFVSTAAWPSLPDGMLVAAEESKVAPLSGVYGLRWLPTGPQVMIRILRHLGFEEVRCCGWRVSLGNSRFDLLQVVAGRTAGSLSHFDKAEQGLLKFVQRTVQPRSVILVANDGQDRLRNIPSREVWVFPRDSTGSYDPSLDGQGEALMAHLEECRLKGAGYLLIPKFARPWLERNHEFQRSVERRYKSVGGGSEPWLLYDLCQHGKRQTMGEAGFEPA